LVPFYGKVSVKGYINGSFLREKVALIPIVSATL
jgi:hypothetical protein